MDQKIERPNIFKISTKELSQDAFITWLLQWANPKCSALDSILHQCGRDFLSLVMGESLDQTKQIKYLEAGRQWDYVDIWAEIFFEDGTKTLLVIEDKTFSGEHSNQLERYKKQAEDYCYENGFELICTYFKIGSEPLRAIDLIRNKGFNIITRKQIKACLQPYRTAEHSILRDFIAYIDDLEEAHLAFETLASKDWKNYAWVGFYQFIESNLDIITWHWVNNPSGGFWNLCLTWEYWNGSIPVYVQIEQQRICYKIALGEDETGLDNSVTDINAIQDHVFNFLVKFAKDHGETAIKLPIQFVHKGNYRTLAVINQPNWCGDPEELIDKQLILTRLTSIISFYRDFMRNLNKISFKDAEINILKHSHETDVNHNS